ncbi:MAG: hypothetical protein GAK31_00192 [Stenotrophomonas maltophilia]|uniref:PAS domain-containing protein n=1 Tax=Stenotrophomonas maltophilia TaxID=40324 RepID=A0A7V8JMT6_STEMA|nr:MAG: hypothetical protein GAK31_00192 [Stenotrophomonas maltophilia]
MGSRMDLSATRGHALNAPPPGHAHAGQGMGGRIAAFEWHDTALGPSALWPPHLRATVDMMLAHGFPMIVLWGPQLIQLYNDGYAEILADKHPAGLGQATAACWPEIWHINGPIYDRVWQGETITYEDKLYPLARKGVLQDIWFTITYSPIRGADGGIDGVLVTMFDTTSAHAARAARDAEELRRRESERRLALAFKVLPVGVCIVDADGQVQMSNDRMRNYLPSDQMPSADPVNVNRWKGWHADSTPIARRISWPPAPCVARPWYPGWISCSPMTMARSAGPVWPPRRCWTPMAASAACFPLPWTSMRSSAPSSARRCW